MTTDTLGPVRWAGLAGRAALGDRAGVTPASTR